jgi:hypothetical protein
MEEEEEEEEEEDRGYLHSNGSSVPNQSILHRFSIFHVLVPHEPRMRDLRQDFIPNQHFTHMFAFRYQRGRIQYLPTTGFKSGNPQ